nr:hypothetical protein [Tanacetum cinerariifolium]
MTETMEQYMSKTHGNYGSGVVRPMINDKTHFELKGKYLKELRENTFSVSEHEDANEHIKKVLEIVELFHIPKMSKELQERGIEGLPSSTEPNPRDHVKSISTAKANSSAICRIESGPYAVSNARYSNLSFETVTFPSRLDGYYYGDWKETPNVDLGASVSAMSFFTYFNLSLDFVILDIPEDDDVLLTLRRTFLSTAHAKIDDFKIKITLRVGEEKLIFKSIKPATSIIRMVYMVKERMDLDSKIEFVGEAINE